MSGEQQKASVPKRTGADGAAGTPTLTEQEALAAGMSDAAREEMQALWRQQAKQAREQKQTQLQQSHRVSHYESLIEERERNIRELEETANDVASIFEDIAVLVDEAGSTIMTIDENVSRTAMDTEAGAEELEAAARLQQKYRNRQCLLLLIVLAIAAFVVVVVTASR